jgi:molecular chaperone IbpA
MTKLTHLDLTPFYRHSVGVDRLFDRIVNQIDLASNGNYPPYDIIRIDDNTYEIRLAVAGFQQSDINVEYHEGKVTIRGAQSVGNQEDVEYLHHGISNRSFTRTFTLADYVEVKNAVMKDGILTLFLVRELPESQKPKNIAITYLN